MIAIPFFTPCLRGTFKTGGMAFPEHRTVACNRTSLVPHRQVCTRQNMPFDHIRISVLQNSVQGLFSWKIAKSQISSSTETLSVSSSSMTFTSPAVVAQ